MGFMDRIRGAFSSSDDADADEIGQEFAEEIEAEQEADEVEGEQIEEDITEVWDSAYRFVEDWVEEDGHPDMKTFTMKCAFLKVKRSERYRDRIEHGARTIETLADTTKRLDEIAGRDREGTDFGEMADKMQDANRAINQADKLAGKEDMIVAQGLGIARDAVDALANGGMGGGGGVDVDVSETEGEI